MKRANHGTKLEGTPKHEKPPEPAAQTGKNPNDARGDDHKTKEMEEEHRGTFP